MIALLLALLAPALACDGDEISTSRGPKDGVVVLWPRVVPETTDATVTTLAGQVQERLQAIATGLGAETKVDPRPAPERACPQAGCKAAAIGAVLMHQEGGCALVATVAPPGAAPTRLVPWGATVRLKADEVPFREAPETQAVVEDFTACSEILGTLTDDDVSAALRAAGL